MMDSDATNHLRYRVVFLSTDISGYLLENQFNGMAQLGWQLHAITEVDGNLLIIYSGIIDDQPSLIPDPRDIDPDLGW